VTRTDSAVGFVGLGNMGAPMARRLLSAGHDLVVFDSRRVVVDALVTLGARAASSPKDVADQAPTVFASLPTPQVCLHVATGPDGLSGGACIRRYVDLSTVGSSTSKQIAELLTERNITHLDAPVSGGVGGAEQGTLAVMVSGPQSEFDVVQPLLGTFGRVLYLGDQPGAAQTMKLTNNLLAATALAVTSEALVMGSKAGLDPAAMLDVFNAGSGANTATRDKFPRAVLPRTFDYGFATGLMVKDLRLCLAEIRELGLSFPLAEAVGRLWEQTNEQMGPESDFTTVIKPMETAAGVIVAGQPPTR
jgi:3-hydroxyisobutyrate dehydrogenase-like beta-hydroxyacid dehydrogenase